MANTKGGIDAGNTGNNIYTDHEGAQTNFEGLSNLKYDRQSMDGASIFGEARHGAFDANVRRKQLEVLQNPDLKTSLTTNIRNIMRNQDKGLLTTSTRLLNAQVKRAEMKSELDKHHNRSLSPDGTSRPANSNKAISTVELLRKQKESNKMR